MTARRRSRDVRAEPGSRVRSPRRLRARSGYASSCSSCGQRLALELLELRLLGRRLLPVRAEARDADLDLFLARGLRHDEVVLAVRALRDDLLRERLVLRVLAVAGLDAEVARVVLRLVICLGVDRLGLPRKDGDLAHLLVRLGVVDG